VPTPDDTYIQVMYQNEAGDVVGAAHHYFTGEMKARQAMIDLYILTSAQNRSICCIDAMTGETIYVPWHRVLMIRTYHANT